MLLTTTTYNCTDATGPKYWLAWTEGNDLQAQNFGYIMPGYQIATGQQYLEILDDEAALSARVEAIKGDGDWYWQCDVRIQSPPQPNEWVCDTETGYSVPSPVQPEMSVPNPEPTPEI